MCSYVCVECTAGGHILSPPAKIKLNVVELHRKKCCLMLKCNLPPLISMNFQHATDCCMPLVGYILYIAKCKYARAVLFIRIHIYVCLPHSVKCRRILFCLPYVPTHLTTPVEMIITFFYFQVSLIYFSWKLTTYC